MRAQPMAQRIKRWLVDKLSPWARKPRAYSDAQVSAIAASIEEFGFRNPILADTNFGIIASHGRLLAAQKLGLAEVTLRHPGTPGRDDSGLLARVRRTSERLQFGPCKRAAARLA